jgi:hypothetical protein
MPKSFIVAPHVLHFGQLRLSALAGACRVMLPFPGWMVAGAQQESLEAFDKFITAGQMHPGSLKIEKLCLPCCIDRLLGAPLAVRRALVAFPDMLAQFLKHLTGSEFKFTGPEFK